MILVSWLKSIREALRFLSRFPLPSGDASLVGPDWASCLAWSPVAGVAIALGPVGVLVLCWAADVPSLMAGGLATALLILVTGGLHEDGLADVADGFGGGATRERKLEIMRDSRIGAYGTLALGCSLLLRVAGLQHQIEARGVLAAGALLVTAAALSRAFMLVPMVVLLPARRDGLAHRAGGLPLRWGAQAFILAALISGSAAVIAATSPLRLAAAWGLGGIAAAGLTRLARQQIGGVTGDVVGATQQLSEIAVLIALSAGHTLG